MRFDLISIVAVCALAPTTESAAQGDWDVVVNGRAIHLNAARDWNEENWGLGFEKEFDADARWVKVALGSAFRDSLDKPSYMAGGGIKRRFQLRSVAENLYVDLGAIGFVMTREDVNDNRPFPGILPALTVGKRRVAVNVTYLPDSVVDRMTKAHLRDPDMNGVFFIQLKLDAGLFGFGGKRGPLLASSAQE